MAIFNVIKCEMIDGIFCQKYPSDNIKMGSQLIVYPSQSAIFVKGGQICDIFAPGTYTISTENIPIIGALVNLPYGGESPFKAEIWFVNHISKLDMPWGTPHPIQIEDPKYKIIVPVRAHGQYGLKVKESDKFLKNLIGNLSVFTTDKIDSYYKGKIVTLLNSIIAQQIIEKGISVLDINTQLLQMSQECESLLNKMLDKYGVSIIDFNIMSISIPENDPSVIKLKEAKDIKARMDIAGKDVYQMERSFDVLEKAAGNEGAGGQMMAMGAGLGVGVGIGGVLGNMSHQYINTNPIYSNPPSIPNGITYYLYIDGNQVPGNSISQIVSLINEGVVNGDTLAWTSGMSTWMKLRDIPTFSNLCGTPVPPPINN